MIQIRVALSVLIVSAAAVSHLDAVERDAPETSPPVSASDLLAKAARAKAALNEITDEDDKRLRRKQVIDLIAQARRLLKQQLPRDREAWGEFPRFIDPQKNREQFVQRRLAENRYLRTQLQLAMCPMLLAELQAAGDERTANLKKSQSALEEVHTRYRSQLAGLTARLHMARCLQMQGKIKQALGIYNELLAHRARSPSLLSLQDSALHQVLVCLNSESRRDFLLVALKAKRWLQQAQENRRSSRDGLAIRWQLAIALTRLAEDSNREDEERFSDAMEGIEVARDLQKDSKRYSSAASELKQRLEALLTTVPADK